MKRKSLWWVVPVLAAAFVAPLVLRSTEEKKTAASGDAAAGEAIFKKNCQLCHHPDKTTKKLGPGLKGLFNLKELPESKKPPTEELVREQIVNGTKNMPAFGKKLSAEQIENLIAYLKTL
jgi:mono/diheme cytochrome c family protein